MMLKTLWNSFDDGLTKFRFGSGSRIELYRSIALLLENNVALNDGLLELHNVFSDDQKNPGEPLAIVTLECFQAVSNGRKLHQALSRWAPHQEVTLIGSGETSGALATSLKDAIRMISYKQRIKTAVLSATIYPAFLYSLAGILLWVIATILVPKMAKLSDPDTWEGVGYVLSVLSWAVTNFGAYLLAMIVGLLLAVFLSLPRLKGDVRVFFDRAPIYTTYRVLHGSAFLLNVSVMIRSGMLLHDALLLLHQDAQPWLKERIGAAILGTRQGANLGVALDRAGHRFPDKRAIQYLKILASRDGFDEAINRFSQDWVEQCIKRVEQSASISLIISAAIMAGLMALVVLGTLDMQDAIDRSVSART
ncbi:type II secretion system F family protein [Pseudomonas reactans]|uniref:type II secretion system F family protein n=1 Tax=Pseudomonas reactans TaxID=117680 RepID=UPI0015A1764F|nr:type II secretion system F family protein [Pseudomonas reactans]NWC89942.1 type II secretion system F family protein [Pseudomonas reactans]